LWYLPAVDPELFSAIRGELLRVNSYLEMIASENFVPPAIMEVQGSILTNKYAEGYPGRRYHGGCEFVDVAERLAVERAKALFGAEHANVQPHSGVNANLAAYHAVLEPGDLILAMDLKQGGHLSHGSPASITGKLYRAVFYGVRPDSETIDYDQVRDLAKAHRPRMLIAGASAYPRVIDFALFREIADEVGAYLLVDMAHIAGLVAGGVHPSPVPHAHLVTSTTTKTLRGARGGFILCKGELASAVDKAVFPGVQGGPILQNVAAKALTFKLAMTEEFRAYAARVVENAKALASTLLEEGLRLVSGGTDNHMMLVDLRSLDLTGREAEEILSRVGITVNKNLIPNDPRGPDSTSGIRIGTAAVTSRGLKPQDMVEVGRAIALALKSKGKEAERCARAVQEVCERYPLYLDLFERALLLRDREGQA